MNKLIWLSSPLLGLFFAASYYASNILLFTSIQILPAVIGTIVFCSSISLVAYLLSKNKLRANLISVLIVAGLFTWGYNPIIAIIFLFGAMFLGFQKVKDKVLVHSNRIALLLMVGLLVVPLFNIVVYHAGVKYKPINEVVSRSNNPDIYYIILDSYASDDIINSLGYDNSYFTNYLKEKGFIVREDAFCNYSRTYISVPSSLSMNYIRYPDDRPHCFQTIQTNRVFEQAHELGYKVINLGSGWAGTEEILYADENYEINQFINNNFTTQLWGTTLLKYIKLFPNMVEIQRKTILFQLDMLKRLPEVKDQPRFIFAHILIPHHSYALFHGDGSVIEGSPELTVEYVYFEHLDYINRQLKMVVDNIIEKSTEKPIIVLQADEGISTTEFYDQMYSREWVNDVHLMKQRASVLSAYYLPNGIEVPRSSVNTFRFIFSEYFNCDYELLEDTFYYPKVYITKGSGNPSRDFYDATEVIK
jgi:hypothetical protein